MTKVPCGKRTPWSSLSLSCTPIAPCHVHSATACYLVTCAVQPPVTLSHAQRNRWFPCHVRSVTACYLVKCTAQPPVTLPHAQRNRPLPATVVQNIVDPPGIRSRERERATYPRRPTKTVRTQIPPLMILFLGGVIKVPETVVQ